MAHAKDYDTVGNMLRYEQGELGEAETVKLFQSLIDSGMAWSLQGAYGRQAARYIESGQCKPVMRAHPPAWA